MAHIIRRFGRNRLALTGTVILLCVLVAAVGAPWITPYEFAKQGVGDPLSPPTVAHPLGTDELGRDVLTRIVFAARISLTVGLLSTLWAAAAGIPLGMITGYAGGWADSVMMRITDAWLAFPIMVLALGMTAAMGPNLTNVTIAIGFVSIPNFIRLARGQTIVLKRREFIEAARAVAQRDLIILGRHVLPNISSSLIVQSSLTAATAILTESALSFLGVGVMPPQPSWGAMLSNSQPFLSRAPWMAVAPGLSIFLLVMAFNLVGDGLRDALDPKVYD